MQNNHLLNFDNLAWESPMQGVQQKMFVEGKSKIRLLRFNDQFTEPDWCMKDHLGYVLHGEMIIDFNGNLKSFREGDGLRIAAGEIDKHKVIIEKGKHVELIVFDSEE